MMKITKITSINDRIADDINWTAKYLTADRSPSTQSTMSASKTNSSANNSKNTLSAPVLVGPMTRTESDLKINSHRPRPTLSSSTTLYYDKDGPVSRKPSITMTSSSYNQEFGKHASATCGSPYSAEQRVLGSRVPISKTRQKLRKLLCESKGDPDYFN